MSMLKEDKNGRRRYGEWAGNPKGVPEDLTRCAKEVWPSMGSWVPHQCNRKRGFGPAGEFCKQHAKKYTEDK